MIAISGVFRTTMLLAALAACGYMLTTSLVSRRIDPAPACRLDLLEALFSALALAICVAGIIGIVLVEIGWFSLWSVVFALFTIAVAVGLRVVRHGQLRWHVGAVSRYEWPVLGLLLLLCSVLFLRPHEFITGGADAGVYVNIGANIAWTGALFIRDPMLAELDPALDTVLFRPLPPESDVTSVLYPGFYRSDAQPDLLIPQFFTLHPLWLALAAGIGGVRAALAVNPFWAFLGIWALYMFARELIGVRWAWLPALLLAVTPLQVYFSRYPTAEMIAQYFVWLMLWAFTAFVRERPLRALWGMIAGLAIGALFMARIDMIFVLLLPLLYALWLLLTRRWTREELWFWIPLLLSTGYAAAHALLFSRPYTLYTYGTVLRVLWSQLSIVAIVALLLALVLLYLLTAQRRRLLTWARAIAASVRTRHVAVAVLVLIAIVGYVVRPYLGETIVASYWYTGTDIPLTDHLNLIRLGWFITPPAIILGVFGGAVMLEGEPWRKIWPLWVVGASFTVLYLYNILNNPVLIYGMRRYVPVTVPFIMMAAAYGLVRLWALRRWGKVLAGTLLLASFLLWLLYNNRLIWRQADFEGGIAQIEELAGHFADDGILLFVDDAPVGVGVIFGTPLNYLHGLAAFDLQEDALDLPVLLRQIERWQQSGHSVYLVAKAGQPTVLGSEELVHLGEFVWDTPQLEQSYDHAPAALRRSVYELEIYLIEEQR